MGRYPAAAFSNSAFSFSFALQRGKDYLEEHIPFQTSREPQRIDIYIDER